MPQLGDTRRAVPPECRERKRMSREDKAVRDFDREHLYLSDV
jgi:hypothetical protein